MGEYYSPIGNYEVWDEKPEGYFTYDEWHEYYAQLDDNERARIREAYGDVI